MAEYAIEIEIERCPDGVEVVPEDEKTEDHRPFLSEMFSGRPTVWFRWRTQRREKRVFHMGEVSPPIVLQFINAKTDAALRDFIWQYGYIRASRDVEPGLSGPGEETNLSYLLSDQHFFDELLQRFDAGDVEGVAEVFRDFSNPHRTVTRWGFFAPGIAVVRGRFRARPVLSLRPSTLFAFMLLEVGAIIAGDARIMKCAHCSTMFIAGTLGKRKVAMYHSNACRVAAGRARLKAEAVDAQPAASRDPSVTPAKNSLRSKPRVTAIKPMK